MAVYDTRVAGAVMSGHAPIPYTTEPRADTGVSNVTMGFWLFIASEVMLFGALFSSYALLRVSAEDWPVGREVLHLGLGSINTMVLVWVLVLMSRTRRARVGHYRPLVLAASALALVFLAMKGFEYRTEWVEGVRPATNTFFAMYFTLTGLHALHVVGGLIANMWILAGASSVGEAMTRGRLQAVTRYWAFVDLVWLTIFVGLYLL